MNYEQLLADADVISAGHISRSTLEHYQAVIKKFVAFCAAAGLPDPTKERFPTLPNAIKAFLQDRIDGGGLGYGTADSDRSALVWLYKHGEMQDPNNPAWNVTTESTGATVATGNPAQSLKVRKYLTGLRSDKRKNHEPKHAHPITLAMLGQLFDFLDSPDGVAAVSKACALWFKAVASVSFYLMACINEVLELPREKVFFHAVHEGTAHGTIVLADRKTKGALRTYY